MRTHVGADMWISFSVFVTLKDLSCQNGGEFLIQANTQKRQKHPEDDNSIAFEQVEVGSHLMN